MSAGKPQESREFVENIGDNFLTQVKALAALTRRW